MRAHDNLGDAGDERWHAQFFGLGELDTINHSSNMHCRERRRLRPCERVLLRCGRGLPTACKSAQR
jgi:hypothetical protein